MSSDVMTPLALAKAALENWAKDYDTITLTVPGVPIGHQVRLVRSRSDSPLGEVLCVNSDGRTAAMFSSLEVFTYFVRIGMVKITMMKKDGVRGSFIRLDQA